MFSVPLYVLSPPALAQWAEEIERHVESGRLSWARYLPPGAAAAAAAGQAADEEEGDVANRTRRSRRVAAAEGKVRPVGCGGTAGGAGRNHMRECTCILSHRMPCCVVLVAPCPHLRARLLHAPHPTTQVNLARGDPVRPILCRTPDGKLKPMHELDVVLMCASGCCECWPGTCKPGMIGLLDSNAGWSGRCMPAGRGHAPTRVI